jgi:hypothetical protein
MLNDVQKITMNQSFMAAKKKVTVGFAEFYQHDDLNKRKAVKTHRTGITTTIGLNINQHFGAAISWNNYNTFQTRGIKELNDSTKISQIQNTFVFAPYYLIYNEKLVHNITLAICYSRLDDLNKITATFARNSTVNTNIGYSITANKIGFTVSPSFNVLYAENPSMKLLSLGPTVAFGNMFMKGKISTNLSIGFITSRQNDVWTSKTVNNLIGFTYRVTKNHAIKVSNSISYTKYLTSSTHEYKGDVTYTYTFDYIVKNKKEQEKNF